MKQKRSPGGNRGGCWAGTPAGSSTSYHSLPTCQNPVRTVRDLAEEAAIRAEVAGMLAEAYQAAGDVASWRLWRRRRLAHRAIASTAAAALIRKGNYELERGQL